MSYGGTRIPPHNRKGACRKLSTYGCARRISTRRESGLHRRSPGLTPELQSTVQADEVVVTTLCRLPDYAA